MLLTNDDELWNETIKDVTPILKIPYDTSKPPIKISVTPKISPNLVYSGNRLEDLTFGDTANIDANTAKRFHKEKYKIEAELDLHGCTEDAAFEMVVDFIKNSYLKQLRCVRIITGKGRHVEDNFDFFQARSVIKDRVPQWLNMPEIRPLILAINHPQPKNGGNGAILILLRRRRIKKIFQQVLDRQY